MSIDIKNDTYVYLRYYKETGERVNLYLGKIISPEKFEAKQKSISQAAKYFYQTGLRNYKIGELLELEPLRAIRILTKKELLNKSELEGLSLSPSAAKQYKPKGQVKAEEETRLWPQEKIPLNKILREILDIINFSGKKGISLDKIIQHLGLVFPDKEYQRFVEMLAVSDLVKEEIADDKKIFVITNKGKDLLESTKEFILATEDLDNSLKAFGYTKEEETRRLKLLILGFGIEGESFAKEVATKTEVYVFDSIPNNLILAKHRGYKMVRTKQDGLQSADIIVSCMGKKTLNPKDYKILKDDVILIDPKSSITEFDVDWIEKNSSMVKKSSGFSEYVVLGKKITLVEGPITKEKLDKILSKKYEKHYLRTRKKISESDMKHRMQESLLMDDRPFTSEDLRMILEDELVRKKLLSLAEKEKISIGIAENGGLLIGIGKPIKKQKDVSPLLLRGLHGIGTLAIAEMMHRMSNRPFTKKDIINKIEKKGTKSQKMAERSIDYLVAEGYLIETKKDEVAPSEKGKKLVNEFEKIIEIKVK